jgi:predicted DNA repair protein MutK
MRLLSVAGTAAMFLVGGGIMVHGIPALHHLIQAAEHAVGLSAAGPLGGRLLAVVGDALVGLACGAVVLAGVTLVQWLRAWRQPRAV